MDVTLVIPGRNAAGTIGACLNSVTPLLGRDGLTEVIFVDDGSRDDTREIVAKYPVRCVAGPGRGPGAARNLGWRAAGTELVWFVDSDCVAEPDALARLVPYFDRLKLGGVSGSYGNMRPDSLLATLIHEEIIERHRWMRRAMEHRGRIDFLATFNVLYRRAALEEVGGFDERFLKGQDAELSWRVMAAGYDLAFDFDSRVRHFHETRWLKYLRTQRQQGYWRVWLHLGREGRAHRGGDSYSTVVDHVQPPLAMLSLCSLLLLAVPGLRWVPAVAAGLLAVCQVPMTARLVKATGKVRLVWFAMMSFLRAYWRGVGMTTATVRAVFGKRPYGSTYATDGEITAG